MIQDYEILDEIEVSPRTISLTALLQGEGLEGMNDCLFLAVLKGAVILETKWENGSILENQSIPINLKDAATAACLADTPLVLLMRPITGKPIKDIDPLTNVENRAAANVDLLPLLIGEESIDVNVLLIYIATGESTNCYVEISLNAGVGEDPRIPMLLTMFNVACLPQQPKEGTVYLSAISFDGLIDPIAINFGMTSVALSTTHSTWGSISAIGYAAASDYTISSEDFYVPNDLDINRGSGCIFESWNICKRVLINVSNLSERLNVPFYIEVAGVPKNGKAEIRGRYMGFIDGKVLLEPGEFGATISTKVYYYNESKLPENVTPLLELPPSSAKIIVRDTDDVFDESNHMAYITIRLDLMEPLVPKIKIATLFEYMGFKSIDGPLLPTEILHVNPPPEDTAIDVRKIRKEGGALSVHSELSNMACTGTGFMNQSIKRTAANKLLIRIKSMLKQYSPGQCTNIDWQAIVTAQHSSARRAVTASFAPQPPPVFAPSHLGAARARLVGDKRMASVLTETSIRIAPGHPKSFLVKALRCIEEGAEAAAHKYLKEGLKIQPRNKYLLWAFGAQEFHKYPDGLSKAIAVFRIAAKSNNSDGTANAIGWACLHALYHHSDNEYSAFIAAKKMRASYKLFKDWKGFLQRWIDISGEEESLWDPKVINTTNPLIITSAFFLCLRAFKFSELLLKCTESECATRGTKYTIKFNKVPEVNYLRAASFLIRGDIDKAIKQTSEGILKYGPSPKLSQMKATCYLVANGWDGLCENSFKQSEKAGATPSPFLLLRASLGGVKTNPQVSLQRAARAHKAAPCGHSALVLGRIFLHLGEDELAEKWASAAIKLEPNLADGWAFLGYINMQRKDINKARSLVRTAHQVGPITTDMSDDLKDLELTVPIETLSNALTKELCFCHL